jgi:hypothetical protein
VTLFHVEPRVARWLSAIGLAGLAALAVAYGLTYERAPGIRVRWRDDLSAAQQADREWKYLLTNGRAPMARATRSLAYDLQDTSRRNIRALVQDPDVADTNDIDRDEFRVAPKTRPGERWMWIAHRIPVLRHAAGLWSFVALLSVMAVVGLLGVAAERRRQAALRGPAGENVTGDDIFERLPSVLSMFAPPAGGTGRYRLRRAGAAVLVLLAIGAPVLETWEALCLGIGMLVIVFSVGRPEAWRLLAAALLVLVIVTLKAALPRADIAEGHNAFIVMGEGEPLQQGLPPAIFQDWKEQFDALYPAESEPSPPFSWRAHHAVPSALFSGSSDAIWRAPKYSRQVDAIGFRTLADFRGGFANDTQFNFWSGQIARGMLPFYAMYELTPASVGSELAWKGQVFWQRADDAFEQIVHDDVAGRTIRPEDAGRRVYAAFFPQRDPQLAFELRPSLTLRLSGWLKVLLTFGGVLGVLVLTVRPRWPGFLRAASTVAVSYLLVTWFTLLLGVPFLGKSYPPHNGGDDGLQHDAWGRMMATLAGRGDVIEALKGGEAVYWFTPGMRYVRMAEKLIFGDTNHLYALLLSCVPLVLFYLMRHFLGTRRAWVATAVFLCMPVGNLSFLQYVTNARIGYAEAAGAAIFLLGLVTLLRTPPGAVGSGRDLPVLWASGALLAASMFIRPNFSLAVVWLGAAYTWSAWRCRDARAIIALALGLGLALWMPFHNWYYGGEFVLISKSGATISVPLGPRDYLVAVIDAARGQYDTQAVALTSKQVQGWLEGPGFVELYKDALLPFAWVMHAVKVVALLLTCWVALGWVMTAGRRGDRDLALVAVAAILAHVPMLFIFATQYRYAMLAWDLCLVVLVVWSVRFVTAPDAARANATAGVRGTVGVLQPR